MLIREIPTNYNDENIVRTDKDIQKIMLAINQQVKVNNNEDYNRERFYVIGLNTKHYIKYIDMTALGDLNTTLVHPREVYRLAVLNSIDSIIVAHNHPSGDPAPSEQDVELTSRLKDAGKILGIELIDHIVVGNDSNRFISMLAKKLI